MIIPRWVNNEDCCSCNSNEDFLRQWHRIFSVGLCVLFAPGLNFEFPQFRASAAMTPERCKSKQENYIEVLEKFKRSKLILGKFLKELGNILGSFVKILMKL